MRCDPLTRREQFESTYNSLLEDPLGVILFTDLLHLLFVISTIRIYGILEVAGCAHQLEHCCQAPRRGLPFNLIKGITESA